MKNDLSTDVPIAFASGCQKLGQPVPLSYFVSEENSGRSQPAHANVPLRFSALSGLLPARSVPCLRSTSYCAGVRMRRHSSSLFSISNLAAGAASVELQRRAAMVASAPAVPRKTLRRLIMSRFLRLAPQLLETLIAAAVPAVEFIA